jgi:hypothetical protein
MVLYVNRRNAETFGFGCGEFAVVPSFRHSGRLLLYCGVRKEEWQNDFFWGGWCATARVVSSGGTSSSHVPFSAALRLGERYNPEWHEQCAKVDPPSALAV